MSTQAISRLTPSPGSRRITLDLAKFSLDLGWARGVANSAARNEAYPSPPMSGSPSHPTRHKNDFDDRGYGGFGGPLHARQQIGPVGGIHDTERDGLRENPTSYGSSASGQYGMYQQGGSVQVDNTQYHYPGQQQILIQQRPLPPYQFNNTAPALNTYAAAAERVPNNPPTEPAPAPKTQRKTKGHVASACVPCKRAHLRCDAMRPCSRCVAGGKEDACIDVQHKKRGRPRLRDDRENRFDSNLYPRGPELLRRPISVYPGDGHGIHSDPLMRSSYRVLKSQAGPSQPAPRYLDHASMSDANIYGAPAQRQVMPQDVPCAYLNMDFQIIKATQAFCNSVGVSIVAGRKLHDIVVPSERDKIENLKGEFEAQRQRREPHYLPPLQGKAGEDRLIQSVGFGVEEMRRIPMNRHGVVTFPGQNGEHQSFELKMCLAKRDTTFFISLKLVPPPQHQMPPMYPVASFTRDPQYGLQQNFQPAFTPQPFQQYQYQPPMQLQPSPQQHTYDEPRMQDQSSIYRPMMATTTPLQHTMPLTASMLNSDLSAYSRPSSSASGLMRSEPAYAQPLYAPQAPRSDMLPQEAQLSRPLMAQSEQLQLPPIRSHGSPIVSSNIGMSSLSGPGSAFRDGTSRVDIGGLLDKPALSRRTSRG